MEGLRGACGPGFIPSPCTQAAAPRHHTATRPNPGRALPRPLPPWAPMHWPIPPAVSTFSWFPALPSFQPKLELRTLTNSVTRSSLCFLSFSPLSEKQQQNLCAHHPVWRYLVYQGLLTNRFAPNSLLFEPPTPGTEMSFDPLARC